MQEFARLHSVEAVETAVRIMRAGKSETNRLMAVSMILDRAWGKPRQSVEIEQQGQTLEQTLVAIWEGGDPLSDSSSLPTEEPKAASLRAGKDGWPRIRPRDQPTRSPDRFSLRFLVPAEARSKKGKSACGDLNHPRPTLRLDGEPTAHQESRWLILGPARPGASHLRQCGEDTLRRVVTPGSHFFLFRISKGGGVSHRVMTSSGPSAPRRTIGAKLKPGKRCQAVGPYIAHGDSGL
jgi:hypothetical protein